MSDDPIARLGAHQTAGIAILNNELKAVHDDASEASAIEREKAWVADLKAVALPFGPAFVSLLVPYIGEFEEDELRQIGEYLEDEDGHVAVEARSEEHFMSLLMLAVRLHRIQKKLQQLDTGTSWIDAAPVAKKLRGRPSDKPATEKLYRKLAAEIDKRGKGVTIRKKCGDIAGRPDIDKLKISAQTIERETLPYRKKRGRKISRPNFPRR